MKINQKGFSVVEVLLVVVVVGVIGAAGWFVYDRSSNKEAADKNQQPAPQLVQASDTSNTFGFAYPDTWAQKPYEEWSPCCHDLTEEELKEPDWTKVTRPITLHPKSNENATVGIDMIKYDDYWKSFENVKAIVKEDYFAKVLFEGKRQDGHEAIFSRVDYLGPPDTKVESFTDHRYYFDNGEYMLKVEFREKYHHDWPDNEMGPDVNNTTYLSDFESIAKSIKFTK